MRRNSFQFLIKSLFRAKIHYFYHERNHLLVLYTFSFTFALVSCKRFINSFSIFIVLLLIGRNVFSLVMLI